MLALPLTTIKEKEMTYFILLVNLAGYEKYFLIICCFEWTKAQIQVPHDNFYENFKVN